MIVRLFSELSLGGQTISSPLCIFFYFGILIFTNLFLFFLIPLPNKISSLISTYISSVKLIINNPIYNVCSGIEIFFSCLILDTMFFTSLITVVTINDKAITAIQNTGDTNSPALPLMSHRKADNKPLFSSVVLVNLKLASLLRNDKNIISIFLSPILSLMVIWGNGIIEPFPK